MSKSKQQSLDPKSWSQFRKLAHQSLDTAIDHMADYNNGPVWRPVPAAIKQRLQQPLPLEGTSLEEVSAELAELVLPYGTGNTHPKFFGWVHGAGSAGGLIADIMTSALNANLGGRDHAAIYMERQVIEWCRELFGFPRQASGLLVSGTSMATLISLKTARDRHQGAKNETVKMVGYASNQAHACISKTFDILGLGKQSLRLIAVDGEFRMDLQALEQNIIEDIENGFLPFCIVGTAGSVNVGSIDDLAGIAKIARKYELWFHVDGAFGALGILSDEVRPRLRGLEKAQSLALDFHKWMHVNYDAGLVLIADGSAHRRAFSDRPDYLAAEQRGLAGGNPWFCEYGPELSRGFRAAKVWCQMKEHGLNRIGEKITDNCQQARHLAKRIEQGQTLELLAPVLLNIVCFRVCRPGRSVEQLNRLNRQIVVALQEKGIAAPSTTMIGNKLAIRVNITNHRTKTGDLDELVEACIRLGREIN